MLDNRTCPNCRCTIVPTLGEQTGKRTSKVKGERVKVPQSMTYTEWKKVYVDKEISGRNIKGIVLTENRIAEIKKAEDNAFKTKTDANFGFKKINGNAAWAKEILLINDITAGLERRLNCQRCVVAFEARMRGYDVIARPSWGDKDPLRIAREWLSAFDYSPGDIKKARGNTIDEVIKSLEEIIKSFGENSRAIVWFQWDKDKINLNGGHAIVAQRTQAGLINFGDPQTKRDSVKNIIRFAALDSIGILRVDNLNFTDIVKRCCMNRG